MNNKRKHANRRRAVTIVSTAIVGFPVLLVASALAIDFGKIFGSQGDMQRTADAAALAAAGALSTRKGNPNQLADARAAAVQYVESNHVFGEEVTIEPLVDVIFGQSRRNKVTGVYNFKVTNKNPNAARVIVRHTANSPNGSSSLLFAKAFGVSSTNITSGAAAAYFENSNDDSSLDSSDDSMDGDSSGSSDSSDASKDASGGSQDSEDNSHDASSGDSNGPDGSSGPGEDSSDSVESSDNGDESSIDLDDSKDAPAHVILFE
ncbi:MAG: pilus assembly protein TadG-related protein [Phycisphaerae bacterium]